MIASGNLNLYALRISAVFSLSLFQFYHQKIADEIAQDL